MQLFGNSDKSFKCYDSIDNLVIGLWVKIHKTGDLTLLSKEKKTKYSFAELLKAWEKINDEYLESFGLSEEQEYVLRERRMAAIEKANYIINGMTHHLTHAEVHEQNANFNPIKVEGTNIVQNMARLTKHYGVRLKENELTVREYYTYLKEANNGTKES